MASSQDAIWKAVCKKIKKKVSADTYERWFSRTKLLESDENEITVEVPNHIYQVWIETNYMMTLQEAIIDTLNGGRKVQFQFSQSTADAETPAPGLAVAVADRDTAPEGDFTLKGVDSEKSAGDGSMGRSSGTNAVAGDWNHRCTFDTFVVGAHNKFAHAAAKAVGESPAMTYNPLFIYSGVGLGKTHLMHSIGQHILAKKGKKAKVVYVTSEKFTNEFIDAIQRGSVVQFRKRYRQADVLLIDDIQFIAGKESTQEEFFHTFNSLADGHKQVVLSSDRPPSEISNLEKRLVSRFEWGLTAEMQPPDVETRIAILRKKMADWRVEVAPDVIEFLAERIRNNVRRLEGGLMRVASYSSLSGGTLTVDAMEHLLKDILQEEARKVVTIDAIQKRVAEHYDVRVADMTSKRRPANIAFPRQIAMFLARELTSSSLAEIGEAFGGRDHGTVIHAVKTVKAKMGDRKEVRQAVSFLRDRVRE